MAVAPARTAGRATTEGASTAVVDRTAVRATARAVRAATTAASPATVARAVMVDRQPVTRASTLRCSRRQRIAGATATPALRRAPAARASAIPRATPARR